MSERLIEKIDRLGTEAGVETMTPEIRRFALLVRQDTVAQWPKREWAELTDEQLLACTVHNRFEYDPPYINNVGETRVARHEVALRATYENINSKLKEKNT